MSAMKIKKGDTVKVIAGKDNGKEGKVLAVNAKDNTVVVENINKVTKHSKPSAANQQGLLSSKDLIKASFLTERGTLKKMTGSPPMTLLTRSQVYF